MDIADLQFPYVFVLPNPAHCPAIFVDVLNLRGFRIGEADKVRTGLNDGSQLLALGFQLLALGNIGRNTGVTNGISSRVPNHEAAIMDPPNSAVGARDTIFH